MKFIKYLPVIPVFIVLNSCITQFIPKTNEDNRILVVDGIITDLPGADTIKLTESMPLGTKSVPRPVRGCTVTISDDEGNSFNLTETPAGAYVTDPSVFHGIIGRSYTLHILTGETNKHSFESAPMELKAVPPIDSLYYEKVTLGESNDNISQEGCQIYLSTHDPTNQCKYFRWAYTETWEIDLPYTVPNKFCWVTAKSDLINIRNTSTLGEVRVDRYPINFVSNLTDRLRVRYSILLKQYSLSEDEYLYWEKLQTVTDQVGGLYDIIPSSIPSNVTCLDDPNVRVLGYFSVSACSTRRLFVKDQFKGIVTPYTDKLCIVDTIFGSEPIPSLGSFVWVIIDHPVPPPDYRVTTRTRGCYDCTVRGTNIKPDFWDVEK